MKLTDKLKTIWTAIKEAWPMVMTLWVMGIVTFLVVRLADKDLLEAANPVLLGLIGTIITAAFVVVHFWFKNRK
jgi:hypothetical protein